MTGRETFQGLVTVGVIGYFGYSAWQAQHPKAFVPMAAVDQTETVALQAAAVEAGSVTTAPTTPVAQTGPLRVTPDAEAKVIQIVAKYLAAYGAAPNDMLKGATRPKRAREICTVVKGPKVKDWVGRVEKLDSNRDGKGILTIRIASNITIGTMSLDFDQDGQSTLIANPSPLFDTVSSLAVGDAVTFDGTVFYDHSDCLKEMSLSVEGSMTAPDYLMRFSSVRRLTDANH